LLRSDVDQDHWLYERCRTRRRLEVFRQPGAVVIGQRELNPAAENAKHLPADCWPHVGGPGRGLDRVYLGNEFAYAIDGKPVMSNGRTAYVAAGIISQIANLPVTSIDLA
jgi:hypothetical protein